MQIEAEARKYVTDAIDLEKDLQEEENLQKARGTILSGTNCARCAPLTQLRRKAQPTR